MSRPYPRETHELPCPLTREEREQAGKDLANTLDEIGEVDDELAGHKANAKAKLTHLEDQKRELAEMLKTGMQERPVTVFWEMDKEEKQATLIREDTGEAVRTRPMTMDELQEAFEYDDPDDASDEVEKEEGETEAAPA